MSTDQDLNRKLTPTYLIPLQSRKIRKIQKLLVRTDAQLKNTDAYVEYKIILFRPYLSEKNPQKYDDIKMPSRKVL